MSKKAALIVLTAIIALFSISSASAFKMNRGVSGCITHIVNSNETLASILNSYQISYQAIEPYNSSIAKGVTAGESLYLPKSEIGKTAQGSTTIPDSLQQKATPKVVEKEVKVAETHFVRHIVAHGETIYSISRFYNISAEDISAANPTITTSQLSRGMVIRVPKASAIAAAQAIKEQNRVDTLPDYRSMMINVEPSVRTIEKEYSEPYIPIKAALILPLESEERSVKGFIEFYQGFLIGVDSLKSEGVSIDLKVINSSTNLTELSKVLRSGELDDSDIIIGPVYDQQFCAVAHYAAQRQIPIVSPLGEVNCGSGMAFQVMPSAETRYEKFYDDIKGKKLIYFPTPSDDKEFLDSITTIANDTLTQIEFNLKLPADQYLDHLSKDSTNLFVVAATAHKDIDELVSKIGAIRTMASGYRSSTIASSKVTRYATLEPSALFKANISFPAPYHANRTSSKVLEFDTRYITTYNTTPSLYSYRGYDVALFFLGSMKEFGSHFYKYIEGYHTTILQVKYRFNQKSPQHTFTNQEWAKVQYLPNYNIVVD